MSEPTQADVDSLIADASASRRTFMQACLAALAAATATPALGKPRSSTAAGDLLAKPKGKKALGDFTFFHFSDSHIDPRPAGIEYNPQGRSVQALKWIAENTGQPIKQNQYKVEAEAPHFAVHTGDVFEYSVIDDTWRDWERAISGFQCPIAPIPGNHDNTWGEINRELRSRFGDENYSFDYAGCHFICLNSAGLLDPLPAWDRRTLTWLAEDLKHVQRETPIFLAMHHPLSGESGYASPFDRLRFWDVIQDHNVVLVMDGHWHTVHAQNWQGWDRVNGGATFGPHTGYSSITVRDGVLRVTFNYWQENDARPKGKDQVPLVEKPLARTRVERPFKVRPVNKAEIAQGKPVLPQVDVKGNANVAAIAWLDDRKKSPVKLEQNGAKLRGKLATKNLEPGWHYATVRVEQAGGAPALEYGESFWLEPATDAPFNVKRFQGAAAIKTQPVVADGRVIVGDTAGMVTGLSLDLKPEWKYSTGSQIVQSLAAADGLVIVADVDGNVHALRATSGDKEWKRKLPNAIYAPAAIVGKHAIVADSAGWIHALHLGNGRPAWSKKVAAFGFESQPLVHKDLVFAGAWDGKLYALQHANGEPAWQAFCPTWHKDMKSRYYAPADASPIIAGGSVLVTDRGYRLGRYALANGEYQGLVREQIAAIATNAAADAIYTRGLGNKLVKLAADGSELWTHATPLGRAPTAPVAIGSRVAVVSDTGLLSVVDDATGKEEFKLSLSPSLFVLSGLGTDGKSRLFAADLDGHLTAVDLT